VEELTAATPHSSHSLVVASAAARRDDLLTLDQAVALWLDTKAKRSGSLRTLGAYRETLGAFRARLQALGLDLDSEERKVALVAQAFADARDPLHSRHAAQSVTPGTYNQRLAVISSFYYFVRRRRVLALTNPIEMLERRKDETYASARPLDPRQVTRQMAAIDRDSLGGVRDYALLSVALYTGKRLAELARLTWGDLELVGGVVTLTFHGKGGKTLREELSREVGDALLRWLYRWYGVGVGRLPADAPLWVSLAPNGRRGAGHHLTARAISDVCKKRLGTSKVHALRHTYAAAMEAVGAPVSEIQARLGHSSLSTTGRYLAKLRSPKNPHGDDLALMLGLK
jgi:integrase